MCIRDRLYTVTVSAYNDVGTGPQSDNRIQQTEQAEPTSSPENIIFSSVEARSLNVSWDEVSGKNGPITGYLLYYTNSTFSQHTMMLELDQQVIIEYNRQNKLNLLLLQRT